MKKLELSMFLGLCAAVAIAALQIPFSLGCERLRGDTLRLHVVANSDGEADQRVKLEVRDAVLKSTGAALSEAKDAADAAETARALLPQIERAANASLAQNGASYRASAKIVKMYFPKREYGGATLPEGEYTALRVELGAAAGRNWWCVVYPSLCLPAASEENPLEEYDELERELISEPRRYKLRFKTEELLQRWFVRQDEDA